MDTSSNEFQGGRYLVLLIALFFAGLAFASSVSAGSPTGGKGDSGEPAHRTPTSTSLPTSTPTACTIRFADVPDDNTFYNSVQCLACKRIIGGEGIGGSH